MSTSFRPGDVVIDRCTVEQVAPVGDKLWLRVSDGLLVVAVDDAVLEQAAGTSPAEQQFISSGGQE